jgi:NADH-quinone oxidoreductase subunit M
MDINTHLPAFPLLSTMTLVPLVTILVMWRSSSTKMTLRSGYAGTLLNFLLGIYLLYIFNSENPCIQLAEHAHFLGMSYAVGADNSNILFFPLTTTLSLLALIYTSMTRHATDKTALICLLGYQTILIGAFAALNILQFWFWCVLELVPVFILTLHSGTGQNRRWAVRLFLQYWGSGLLMTLAGFILLAVGLIDSEHPLTFDWLTLKQNSAYLHDEVLIFLLLFFGFAVRMPLFPFHGWLPLLAEQGTVTSSTVYLVGLKLGVYALIRFVLPMVPGVAEQWDTFVLTLCLISIFYGAVLALMQINIRRLIAFAVLSHTGILVIGVFSFNKLGIEGSLLLSIVYGLATAGILFCSGLIFERIRTSFIPRMGGLFDTNAVIALLFLICALGMILMPGTLGFNAGHVLIEGTIEDSDWLIAIAILLGNVVAAAFLLRAFQQIFIAESKRRLQPSHSKHHSEIKEGIITAIICGLLIVSGFWSTPWLKFVNQDANAITFMYPMHNPPKYEKNVIPDTITAPLDTQDGRNE